MVPTSLSLYLSFSLHVEVFAFRSHGNLGFVSMLCMMILLGVELETMARCLLPSCRIGGFAGNSEGKNKIEELRSENEVKPRILSVLHTAGLMQVSSDSFFFFLSFLSKK